MEYPQEKYEYHNTNEEDKKYFQSIKQKENDRLESVFKTGITDLNILLENQRLVNQLNANEIAFPEDTSYEIIKSFYHKLNFKDKISFGVMMGPTHTHYFNENGELKNKILSANSRTITIKSNPKNIEEFSTEYANIINEEVEKDLEKFPEVNPKNYVYMIYCPLLNLNKKDSNTSYYTRYAKLVIV